jgi:hypothetical protein
MTIRSASDAAAQYLFLFLFLVGPSFANGQSIDISLPLDRSVYQRNASSNAQVPIAIQFENADARKFSLKVDRISAQTGASPVPVSIETANIPTNGVFQTTRQLSAGWYRLEIKTIRQDNTELETASVKFGVGEVIYTAGQSNIQGIELGTAGSPVLPGEPYDGLSAINQNCFCKRTYPFPVFEKMVRGADDTQRKVGPTANQNLWCYEVIGRQVSDHLGGVPVALFSTASTGTTVGNWSDSANDPNAITHSPWTVNCTTSIPQWGSEGAEGHPYLALRTALNFYGGMFGARVIVWHQGESDNHVGTATSTYQEQLQNVIHRSRQHFDGNLGWAISRVSLFPPASNGAQIIAAQENAKNSTPNTIWGAYYSDQLTYEMGQRQSGNGHFNQEGLKSLGQQIALGYDAINTTPPGGASYQGISTLSPVEARPVPTLSIAKAGSTYTLTVDGTHQSYCWVQDDGPINTCQYTTQSISVSTGKWRCYVTHLDPNPVSGHEKRNVSLTRNVRLPLTDFSPSLSSGQISVGEN